MSSMNPSDIGWVLICSALVLLMTPGLAFFYGGLARSKNVAATIMHSLMSMGIVSVAWVLWGYSLAFAPDYGHFIGDLSYLGLNNVSATEAGPYADNIPHQTFMVFQGMFAIISCALVTGAFAERVKFISYLLFTVLWLTLVYVPVAHWVWGGGWIHDLGALDFAGGNVVHINTGVAALAAALIFGKRIGFTQEPMEPHNIPLVVIGAGILWFGWFGFNAGSALAVNGTAVNAFVVTSTSAAAGVLGWTAASWIIHRKPSVIGAASGAVAGLVGITPAAGYVGPLPAIAIGLVAGILCLIASEFLVKIKLDDSLSVWGVHGIGGTWGALATGIFVGVGYGTIEGFTDVSRTEQIVAQLISIVATWVWSFVATAAIFWVLKITVGLRVSDEDEIVGLDSAEHGETAYRL
jgi:Amt family ammonium transporter